jgi:hypothetical protein
MQSLQKVALEQLALEQEHNMYATARDNHKKRAANLLLGMIANLHQLEVLHVWVHVTDQSYVKHHF